MLRNAAVADALQAVNGDGVHTSMLLSATGALLGIACASRHIPDNARVAAVTSSIWAEYSKASEKSLGGRQLQLLLLDMEAGRIGVAAVDEEYLLACVAAPTAMWGMLKLKLEQAAEVFGQRLQKLGQVNPPDEDSADEDAASAAASDSVASAQPAAADAAGAAAAAPEPAEAAGAGEGPGDGDPAA